MFSKSARFLTSATTIMATVGAATASEAEATGGSTTSSSSTQPNKKQQFTQPGFKALRIATYMSSTDPRNTSSTSSTTDQVVSIGSVIAQLSDTVFAVDFRDSYLTSPVEVGARVYIAYEKDSADDGFLIGALVIKVNANGTFGVLLDNNKLDLAVPQDKIAISEGRCKFLGLDHFRDVMEWLKSAGVQSVEDQHSTACVLYHRGWRADRLYLLETPDVQQMTHLTKSARMSILEKAEWQRDHHRQMRSIYKERIKEKDKRYLFSKYAGIISASVAFVGASSLFGWNYKNYLKQQRSYQMGFAVQALSKKTQKRPLPAGKSKKVTRGSEEKWLRQVFRQLDTAHPRIVVITGYFGCGKSSLCRTAIEKENLPAVFVDVRNKEDTLRSIIKALGVPYVDSCGDPLDFISDACCQASQVMGDGQTPIFVLKLREGDNLTRVYNEAVTLACDRRMCHLVIEVPLESLTMANTSLPRLDFYTVPNFSRVQAYEYTQHRIDPLDMELFLDTVGTNSNDLDELFAAVHQRQVSPTEYTSQKLLKAMRQLQAAWMGNPDLEAAVQRLADFPYEDGQHEGVDEYYLHSPALRGIVMYNPVQDAWLFNNQVLYTAARCLRRIPEAKPKVE